MKDGKEGSKAGSQTSEETAAVGRVIPHGP